VKGGVDALVLQEEFDQEGLETEWFFLVAVAVDVNFCLESEFQHLVECDVSHCGGGTLAVSVILCE
jgi:hypothetical protein